MNRFDAVGTWIAHTTATRVVRVVLDALHAVGVDPLPVKGVVLARTLYEDVSERPISDVDLRVAPRELPRVMRVAAELGWPVRWDSREYGARSLPFPEMLVEISTSVGPPGMCGLSVDMMRDRATQVLEPFGIPYLVPELHDHVLLLCVNVFKDKFDDAMPWCRRDLEKVAVHREFDPERLVELAREVRAETLVWLVADWATRALDEPNAVVVWQGIRDRIRPRRGYAWAFGALRRAGESGKGLLPVVARVVSDARTERVKALALGAVGTAQYAWRQRGG